MALKWIGREQGIEGLPGIPGRDLSDSEVEQYGGEMALIATGLYRRLESLEDITGFLRNLFADGIEAKERFDAMMYSPGVSLSAEQESEIRRLVDSGDMVGAQKIILDTLDAWEKEHYQPQLEKRTSMGRTRRSDEKAADTPAPDKD